MDWTRKTYAKTYAYDSLGNLVQENGPDSRDQTTYQYNSLNQMVARKECGYVQSITRIHDYGYTYDGRGNLIKEEEICSPTTQGPKNITIATYTYDETNKMVSGTNKDGEVSNYTFNGLGVRVGTEVIVKDNTHGYTDFHCQTPTVETGIDKPEVVLSDYVIDYTRLNIDQRVLVKSETDGYDFRYTYGLDLVNVKATGEGTNWWAQNVKKCVYSDYVHTDRLGSVVNLTDQYGRVPAQVDYDDWGKVTAYQSLNISGGYRTVLPEITYAGHQYDDVLGMYYAKARMYDAENRRFAAMDPVKGRITEPMTMVQYLYVVDDPLRWVDVTGEEYLLVDGKAVYINDDSWTQSGYVQLNELKNILNQHNINATKQYSVSAAYPEGNISGKINGMRYSINLFNMYELNRDRGIFLGKGYVGSKYFAVIYCKGNEEVYVSLNQLPSAVGLQNRLKFANETEVAIAYIKEVTEYAKEYKANASKSDTNWLVSMYLRQLNPAYLSQTWDSTGGQIDTGFVNYVNTKNGQIAKFFTPSTRISIESGQTDVLHMFATLSALYYQSDWSSASDIKNSIKFQFMKEKHIDNMAGWVGDLHTLMLDVFNELDTSGLNANYENTKKKTQELIGNSMYSFSKDDFNADVDAVNLFNASKNEYIADVIENYYGLGLQTRYTDFAKSITGSEKPGVNDIASAAKEYTGEKYLGVIGWPLLKGHSVSGDQQRAFADAFAAYLYNLMEGEK